MKEDTTDKKVTPEVAPSTSASATPSEHKHSSSKKPMTFWAMIGALVLVVAGGGAWAYMQSMPKPVVEKKVYKVGVMTIDNYQQNSGDAVKQGVTMALEAQKSDLFDIELVMKPTDCKADLSKKAMEEFAVEGVVAVIGEFCSDATLGAAPVANENKIPLISGASTSPAVTTAGDYVYRTIPSDALAIDYTAELMYNKYNVRKVAILHSNDSYGNGGRDALKASLEKRGAQIVSDESYDKTETDVRAKLRKNMASKPDAFYTLGATGINGSIMFQKKEIGFNVQLFGPETFKSERNVTSAKGAAEGILVVGVSDGTAEFKEKYEATYGQPVNNPYTAMYHDAMQSIIEALKLGATSGETVKTQLDKLSFDGATTKIDFDSNGDVAGKYSLFTIKNNKPVVIEL